MCAGIYFMLRSYLQRRRVFSSEMWSSSDFESLEQKEEVIHYMYSPKWTHMLLPLALEERTFSFFSLPSDEVHKVGR